MLVNFLGYSLLAHSRIRKCDATTIIKASNNQTEYLLGSADYIQHYGIRDMKWGIRRFQNADGTLTEEGKKRYGRDSIPESETWKKSDASKLSDDELRRRNNRLQTERQYRDLTTSQKERDRTQLKNEIVKDLLKKALIIPIGAIFAYAGTKFIKNNGIKMVDLFEKCGKKLVQNIRTNSILKSSGKPNLGRYSSPTGPAYGGGLLRNVKNKIKPRTFNYYPKAKGGVPREWPWPTIRNRG